MVQLRREGKLLTQVNRKPHATRADHHDALPTPPATNRTRSSASQAHQIEDDDTYGSPVSSEDEEAPSLHPSYTDGVQDEPPMRPAFQQAQGHARTPERAIGQFMRPASIRNPESTRSKRSNETDEQKSSDNDELFSSQSSKRPKIGGNFHARHRDKVVYGKRSQRPQTFSNAQRFKSPEQPRQKAPRESAAPKFQHAPEVDMFEFKGDATFKAPSDARPRGQNSLSPSLSSLTSVPDSPEVEEIGELNLPAPRPYCAKTTCDICGMTVDLLLKQNFEDEFTNGKSMSFKWQQRFCGQHKQQWARERWEEKGWPEIDWAGLDRRMQRFHEHLRDVIYSRVPSSWKDDLQRQLRPSKSRRKEERDAVKSKMVKPAAFTGYYGPRGAKEMADHIIDHLSDDLRESASKDKVVAAVGVRGGVSGFVQAVLVPELACQLVVEDLNVSVDGAKPIIGESAVEGELLNPDIDDKVTADANGNEMEE